VYKAIFVYAIQLCFKYRNACCCLGEIFVFPVFVIWSGWPLAAPFLAAVSSRSAVNYVAVGIMTLFTLYFMYVAKTLLKEYWQIESHSLTPVLRIEHLYIDVPTHGFRIRIVGTKPRDFFITSATLNLEGEDFFEQLYSAVGWTVRQGLRVFRQSSLPLLITPDAMKPADIKAESTTFDTTIEVPVFLAICF
jgi:hypothetical protein